MPPRNIIILGAGPSGLSAAISLANLAPSPDAPSLQITVVELRSSLQTIGGTINLTPLAMRYLDDLGAGERIRKQAIDLNDGLDYISLRTGRRIGNIWGGIGSLRSKRNVLVESLLESLSKNHAGSVEVQWGKRTTEIVETENQVVVKFDDGTTLHGDVLLGCDGLHSAARRLWVEPERQSSFTERVIAMGWVDGAKTTQESSLPMTLSDGGPALRDTAVMSCPNGLLLTSYFEPTRRSIYFGHIMGMKEPEGDVRDGWKLIGGDQAAVRKEVVEAYKTGHVKGLQETIEKCENWHLYPVYILTGGGRWSRGRVMLLGDAAHAMPPQGESTGLAIEDAMLIAHVFERRGSRTVEQLFADYEAVRRSVVDKHFGDAVWALKHIFAETSWVMGIFHEWATWLYLLLKRWGQEDHFGGDVRKLELPA